MFYIYIKADFYGFFRTAKKVDVFNMIKNMVVILTFMCMSIFIRQEKLCLIDFSFSRHREFCNIFFFKINLDSNLSI